jgi:hypothetical protein
VRKAPRRISKIPRRARRYASPHLVCG